MNALKRLSIVVLTVAAAVCAMPAIAGNVNDPTDTTGRGETETRDNPRDETPRETPSHGEPDHGDQSADGEAESDNGGADSPSSPMKPLECIIKMGKDGKLVVVITNHTGKQIAPGTNVDVELAPGYFAAGVASSWIRNGGTLIFAAPQNVEPGPCDAIIFWEPKPKQQIGE